MRVGFAGLVLVIASMGFWGCPGPAYPPDLIVTPQHLVYPAGTSALTFTIAKTWTSSWLAPFTVTPGAPWLTVSPDSGTSSGPSDAVQVTARVDRSQLASGAGTSSITVSAPGVASQTVAVTVERYYGSDFVADVTTPYVGQEVSFSDATVLRPTAGAVTAWRWSFGDGATSAEQNPQHTYLQPGTYTVALEVTTVAGKQTATKAGYIDARKSTTPQHAIVIDGKFDDWADVPSYTDPEGNEHDTDHKLPTDVPALVDHPDVDLLEYKFTHDSSNLYAYFRAKGIIGNTFKSADRTQGGRYYVIVTIDVDNNPDTGYWLNEGGYYPTSPGYDMNMEVEFFNGAFNVGDYINHGATNAPELAQAFADQSNGIVRVLPGTYHYYTEWVMFDDGSIVFTKDKGPTYHGIITIAVSPDGHEAEMKAPFRGFMKDPEGKPIVALGKVINVSFSLEASGELAPGQQWASNTAEPIKGYFLTP